MTALDDDLGWTLGVVFRAYAKACTDVLADLPGTHRGYQVLTAAARDAPESQSALAQRLGIDRTVMTYLLDDLEGAELVARRPAPADRRTRHVVATEHGREQLAKLTERLDHAENHILAGLKAAERRTLRTLLGRAAAHANALDPIASTCDAVEDIAATHRGR